jgi:hypothetical protein
VTARNRLVAWLLVGLGAACVVGGGLASAATAMHPTEHTAWAVAYLVLVGGVAQVALGGAVLAFAPGPSRGAVLAELVCWNVGNAGVLAGVLAGLNVLVDIGGALLVVALVLAVLGVRGAREGGTRGALLNAFRALVLVLLLSIPAGLLLAQFGV